MSSPSSATFVRAQSGWPAHGKAGRMDAPATVERKRRGRGVDVMTLPTPPHSRQNTQLPTPETVRQPRKSDKTSARVQSTAQAASFLPTPQTLPRQRKSLDAPSPSGQTTFIHSTTVTLVEPPISGPRRRPGLTFAQQMGLLSTTSAATSTFGGRLGMGVGMGGGHKSGVHRTVDVIPIQAKVVREDENPFYVSPTVRSRKGVSPTTLIRSVRPSTAEPESDDEMAGPSSPLANRSPADFTLPTPKRARIAPTTPKQTLLSAPVVAAPTPTRRSPRQLAKSAALSAMMDEQNNPFLARPTDIHVARPPAAGEAEHERPYVSYVFRGSKKVFANPFLRPDLPFPSADLNPEDDEFEDHPCPKPRLLWPTAGPTAKAGGSGSRAAEEEEEEATPSPPSSPIRTPKTNRRTRFLNADRSLEAGMFDPPAEVYSDSENEGEKAGRRARRKAGGDTEDDEPTPVRRGLVFGPGSTIPAKRAGEEMAAAQGPSSKKNKAIRM